MVSDSKLSSEQEYSKYIPGKCTFCGSSNVTETLKKTIKSKGRDGFLWEIHCAIVGRSG